ncbi:MAG TPA: MFS transporter [Devosiaceae bacterium]|nr:MFS transporter [Devosiaceae bacterium]
MTHTADRRTAIVLSPMALVIAAGCVIAMTGFGVRSSMGLFTLPVTEQFGWGRETYALALAIQNLVWGIAQPLAGAVADRYGTARTLAAGAIIYSAGVLIMAYAGTPELLYLGAGVLAGIGIATCSFGIVMAAFGRMVAPEKRSFVYGVATAASSAGQFVFAPLGQAFIESFGWQMALVYFALLLLLIVPLSFALRGKADGPSPDQLDLPFGTALRRAFEHRSFALLVLGFFTCGFHLAFITVHLPAYLAECGLTPAVGSWALALIGLFNIVGSLGSGWLGQRMPKQILLSTIYLGRVVATGLFLLLPVTEVTTLIFAATTGLLWLATVPPTAALVATFFGPRYLGMLYGTAFLSHQIGGFFGVWLGGYVFDRTGSYDLVWYLGILLGLASAAMHLPITEAKAPNFQPALAPAQ